MTSIFESDTRLDHDLAWELAIVENQAYDETQVRIEELRQELPVGRIKEFLHRASIVRISEEIQAVTIDAIGEAEDKQHKIQAEVEKNRGRIDDVKYFFNIDDREARKRYYETHNVSKLRQRQQPDLVALRRVGAALHGDMGTSTITLFDSSKPEKPIHGIAVGSTLAYLGFSAKQFTENKETDEKSGVITSSVTIHPGVVGEGDDSTVNEGRRITATYTQTDKDVFVDLEVTVDESAPDVNVPLSDYLQGVLLYKTEYAMGSMWSEIGYKGIGFDAAEQALLLTRQFMALGGKLTPAQEEAYDGLQRYRDYLATEHYRLAKYTS